MDNEIPNRPQQTGGLKLMTVFIVVLALHVMVIGSITVYYLLHGESTDTDLAKNQDNKSNLEAANTDGSLPQAPNPSATTNAPPTAVNTTDVVNPTSAPPPTTVVAAPPVDAAPDLTAPHSVVMPKAHSALEVNLAPASTTGVAEANPVSSTSYVVKAGDTLFKIAKMNHVSVTQIKEANNLSSTLLKVGQKLILPGVSGPTETAAAPAVASPAVVSPAANSGTATASIVNDVPAENPSSVLQPVSTEPKVYTVAKGDTLTKIAHKFKTTPAAIMTANNITDARKLSIGTKLKIPAPAPRTNSANNAPKPTQTQTSNAVTPQLVTFHP